MSVLERKYLTRSISNLLQMEKMKDIWGTTCHVTDPEVIITKEIKAHSNGIKNKKKPEKTITKENKANADKIKNSVKPGDTMTKEVKANDNKIEHSNLKETKSKKVVADANKINTEKHRTIAKEANAKPEKTIKRKVRANDKEFKKPNTIKKVQANAHETNKHVKKPENTIAKEVNANEFNNSKEPKISNGGSYKSCLDLLKRYTKPLCQNSSDTESCSSTKTYDSSLSGLMKSLKSKKCSNTEMSPSNSGSPHSKKMKLDDERCTSNEKFSKSQNITTAEDIEQMQMEAQYASHNHMISSAPLLTQELQISSGSMQALYSQSSVGIGTLLPAVSVMNNTVSVVNHSVEQLSCMFRDEVGVEHRCFNPIANISVNWTCGCNFPK